MNLSSLTVRNFRNLASIDFDLPSEGVVIIGDNGQGKTNFLEAVYYLVLFRSLKGAKDRELVRFGEAGFFLAGNADARVTAGFEVAGRRKKVTVDGKESKKLADAVGQITAVALSPDDRSLVDGGPAGRRRFLDVLLSLSSDGYLSKLTELRAALRQRNAALKSGNTNEAQVFDQPVANAAAFVSSTRYEWAERARPRFIELCDELGENGEPFLEYSSRHWTERGGAEGIAYALRSKVDRDVRRGMTTVGPHRDDLLLTLGGNETRRYGSAGQQRTAATALRLLEAQALEDARGTAPIALFDDAFAELDQDRQERLLNLIGKSLPGQAIITAPRDAEVPKALFDRPRWHMVGGQLEW